MQQICICEGMILYCIQQQLQFHSISLNCFSSLIEVTKKWKSYSRWIHFFRPLNFSAFFLCISSPKFVWNVFSCVIPRTRVCDSSCVIPQFHRGCHHLSKKYGTGIRWTRKTAPSEKMKLHLNEKNISYAEEVEISTGFNEFRLVVFSNNFSNIFWKINCLRREWHCLAECVNIVLLWYLWNG